jgi:hypothetical protein
MQVQPLLPWRTIVALPLSSIVITDALWAMDAGAADSALWIGSFEAGAASFVAAAVVSEAAVFEPVSAGLLHPASAAIAAPISSGLKSVDVMNPSFR